MGTETQNLKLKRPIFCSCFSLGDMRLRTAVAAEIYPQADAHPRGRDPDLSVPLQLGVSRNEEGGHCYCWLTGLNGRA